MIYVIRRLHVLTTIIERNRDVSTVISHGNPYGTFGISPHDGAAGVLPVGQPTRRSLRGSLNPAGSVSILVDLEHEILRLKIIG